MGNPNDRLLVYNVVMFTNKSRRAPPSIMAVHKITGFFRNAWQKNNTEIGFPFKKQHTMFTFKRWGLRIIEKNLCFQLRNSKDVIIHLLNALLTFLRQPNLCYAFEQYFLNFYCMIKIYLMRENTSVKCLNLDQFSISFVSVVFIRLLLLSTLFM